MRHLTALLVFSFSCGLPKVAPDGGDAPDSGPAACQVGETRCEGDLVSTCADDGSGPAFGAAVACGDGLCVGSACRTPTDTQLAQAAELNKTIEYVRANTAWPGPIDWSALEVDGYRRIVRGDGSELAYFDALFHEVIAVPEGHQGIYLTTACGSLVPYGGWVQRGACGRPHPSGIIVTYATPGNPLGVLAGDLIVKVGDHAGTDVLAALGDRPMCMSSTPSAAVRDTSTAASFADLLRKGDVVTVQSPDGGQRTVTMPDAPLSGDLKSSLDCFDPFARRAAKAATSTFIADGGVGLIRVPTFVDPEVQLPSNPTQQQFDAYAATLRMKLQAAFDPVKSAPAIIWDVRGNGGGVTQIALELVSGFPGADPTPISYCQARIVGSDPPDLYPDRYATYQLTPGGTFAYSGKVVILTDGFNYSAADYFTLAAKTRTQAKLIGAATAGAFGAESGSRHFAGPPAFDVVVDQNRCFDAQTMQTLEGHNTTPHIAVDYDPADLAAGRDTVLERALKEVQP